MAQFYIQGLRRVLNMSFYASIMPEYAPTYWNVNDIYGLAQRVCNEETCS